MTEKQLKHFYFPLWNRVTHANDWHMVKGRLHGQRAQQHGPPDITDLYQSVWRLAADTAAKAHRAITPDDLRHATHRVALGHDKSAKDLTNPELDKVAALMKLLAEPDDLDAILDFLHPENAARDRLLYSIERLADDPYTRRVSADRWGTAEWRDLDLQQLKQLAMTLRARKTRRHGDAETRRLNPSSEPSSIPPDSQPSTLNSQPFCPPHLVQGFEPAPTDSSLNPQLPNSQPF